MSDGGRWRRVYSLEWLEAPLLSLGDGERVTWAYCKTGPQSTSVGIYRISTAVAVEQLGNVTSEEFDRRLTVVCQALGWRFDAPTRVLWMPEWIEQNPPQSANVVTSWRKLLENVPDSAIKLEAVEAIHRYLKDSPTIKNHQAYLDAFGDLPRRLRASFRNSQAQAQTQPGSDQGAGIRDLSGRRGAGALARVGSEEKPLRSLDDIADQALLIAKNEPLQNVLKEFDRIARQHGIHDFTIATAERAIHRRANGNLRAMA